MVRPIKVIGQMIKRRRVTFLVLVAIMTVGAVAGLYAISSTDTFSGQTAAGDHEWWQDIGTQGFCENCHQGVMNDIAAGPHKSATLSACATCHTAGGGEHAAAAAACTDCHSSEATDLESPTEAHNGIMAGLGESSTDASQTCQSCHTHVSVNITATPQPPIELIMGG